MHAPEQGAPRRWLTLLAMTGSLCMIMLDISVVGVSLPTMQAELGLSEVQTQWVVNAYILAMASLVALGGRAADSFGKVPAFVTGMIAFAGASVGCALSGSAAAIVGWRAVQGAAAALMQPASASLVVGSFAPGERGKAMAVYAGIPMLLLVAGPPIGGALTQHAGWPWNFWINMPVAAVSLVLTAMARPVEIRRAPAGRDPLGAVLLLSGLPCLIFGLMEAHTLGWRDPMVLAPLVGAAIALPLFVAWELRHPSPLVALSLFRDRRILADAVILSAMQFAMNGLVIYGSAYMQAALGMNPMRAGVALLPMLLPVVFVIHVAGRVYDRVGVRTPALIGTSLATLGMAVQAFAAPSLSYPWLAAGMVLLGTGIGFVMSPTNVDAMHRAGHERRAQASGLVQTLRQVGGTLGVAVIGSTILSGESALTRRFVQASVPAERAEEVARLLQEAAQASPTALGQLAREPALLAAAQRITAGGVAVGWGMATVALAIALLAAWRGLREEPTRTL
ncbi:MAG: DHA2 family efflux MFS transporter permease subunit [Planctomycetes bacterium]|nr:DHA2 family efflux MFS transporter permease subunit [Planctomycetota bacterium]